jgi:hypothetical protein
MRCFIHIVTDTEFIRDREGEDFADWQTAAQEAAQVARDLMAEKLRNGIPLPIRWKVLLALADDTVVMSLPFSKLLPAAEPLPRRARQPVGQQDAMKHRRLAEGRARIEVQKLRIAKMQECGYDTSLSEEFLRILVATLESLTSHRDLILQASSQSNRGFGLSMNSFYGSNRAASSLVTAEY